MYQLQGRIRLLLQLDGLCREDSISNYINVLVTRLDKVAVAVRWSL